MENNITNEQTKNIPSVRFCMKDKIGPTLVFHFFNKEFGICFCHHDPAKSIPFFGLEKIFCSRCLGGLFGILAGVIFFAVFRISISLPLAALLALPLLVDGFSQLLGFRESNNYLRFTTGLLFGFTINSIFEMQVL